MRLEGGEVDELAVRLGPLDPSVSPDWREHRRAP
jgi:hypothetical protein